MKSQSVAMLMMAAMGHMYYPYGPRVHRCKDPIEGVDLVAEGRLIQQKKSKLSASQRRRVMHELRHHPEFQSNSGNCGAPERQREASPLANG